MTFPLFFWPQEVKVGIYSHLIVLYGVLADQGRNEPIKFDCYCSGRGSTFVPENYR